MESINDYGNPVGINIKEPEDFTISFGKTGGPNNTLHISWEDLPKIPDLLNSFLQSQGIDSYVTQE